MHTEPTTDIFPADCVKVGNKCPIVTYHYGGRSHECTTCDHVNSPEQDLKLLIFNIFCCNVAFGGSKPA